VAALTGWLTLLQYANASSVLAAGGIRLQYSNSENVEMCRYSAEFMENMKECVHGWHRCWRRAAW